MKDKEAPQTEDKGEVWEDLTTIIHTWEEEGQMIEGRLERTEPFTEGKFDTEVLSYVLKTPEGLLTTVLGSATDKQLVGKVQEGDMIRITFQGKKELSDGRQVNIFNVQKARHAAHR